MFVTIASMQGSSMLFSLSTRCGTGWVIRRFDQGDAGTARIIGVGGPECILCFDGAAENRRCGRLGELHHLDNCQTYFLRPRRTSTAAHFMHAGSSRCSCRLPPVCR